MRVLNIMLGRGLGGIERAFINYAQGLKLEGCKVMNVTSVSARVNKAINNSCLKLPNLGVWDFISALYLRLIIKIFKPDLVIAHGRRAIKFTNFHPLIGVAHNYNIKDLPACDYIIALTSHMKTYLIERGFDKNKIEIIPNSINLEREDIKYKKLKNRTIKIGALGRFVKKKGFDVFLKALSELKDKCYKFEAILGGEGEEKNNLLKLTGELNLKPNINFLGWIEDTKEFFQNIDIFCVPSLHEPFGIVILEAMKYGVPVISTKTEGPSEIIEDKKTGILVDVNSTRDLAKNLSYYLDQPYLLEKYSKAAYKKLQTNYSDSIVFKKLFLFLKTVISSP